MVRVGQFVAASSLTEALRLRVRQDLDCDKDSEEVMDRTPTKALETPDLFVSPTSVDIKRAEAELEKAAKRNKLFRIQEQLRNEQAATEKFKEEMVIGGMFSVILSSLVFPS